MRECSGGLLMVDCEHCGCNTSTRNPSGYCDHLYYPERCPVCNGAENFLKIIVNMLGDNGQIITTEQSDLVMHEGKVFKISVEEEK